jgi:glycosyltransferase involved in cell wall biosynthesis/SAM-dependent methyltransferase
MADSPLVSVLINNYNYAQFLPEAIDSVLAQTYDRIELVIVDDGSDDGSREVIARYAGRHPNIIPVLKSNGGQASAYNAGVAAATGDILCFLDSDDTWFPEKVSTIVAAHAEHPYVQHDLVRQSRSILAVPSGRFDMRRLLTRYGYSCCMPSSALSLTRELAARLFPMPEEGLRLCADAFVALAATYFGGVHTVDQPLGCYRVHDANRFFHSVTQRRNERQIRYYDALEVVNRWLFERGHYPIPHFNPILGDRMLADVLAIVPGGTYLVYGTGSFADRVVDLIDRAGGVIRAFVDSFPEKWGQTKNGIRIIGPAEIAREASASDRVIVASMRVAEILTVLRRHEVPWAQVAYPPYILRGSEAPAAPGANPSGTADDRYFQKGKHVPGRDEITQYFLERYSASSLLDIGCGTGPVWDLFVAKGLQVTGIDLLPAELVPATVRGARVAYHAIDFLAASLPQRFDAVYSSHTVEHVPDTERFLRAFFANLDPGGAFCLMWPAPKPEIVSGHVHVFNPGLLLYNLVRLGVDCRAVEVVRCGYSLALLGRYRRFTLPDLTHNEGDLDALAAYFPFRAHQDFNGDQVPGLRELAVQSGVLTAACQA